MLFSFDVLHFYLTIIHSFELLPKINEGEDISWCFIGLYIEKGGNSCNKFYPVYICTYILFKFLYYMPNSQKRKGSKDCIHVKFCRLKIITFYWIFFSARHSFEGLDRRLPDYSVRCCVFIVRIFHYVCSIMLIKEPQIKGTSNFEPFILRTTIKENTTALRLRIRRIWICRALRKNAFLL